MKTTILSLVFCIITAICIGQSWEGKITYENSYVSKTEHVTTEQLATMLGTIQEYYVKGGNYKSVVNGKMMEWQLYLVADNRLYTKTKMSTSIMWNDGAMNDDSLISVKVNKEAETVQGFLCDEIIFTFKSGVQKYYYSSKLPVDPSLYKNHLHGNYYDYISRAKALPLKIVIDNPEFTMQGVAVKIEAKSLDNSIFTLPSGVEVVKSPY